MLHRLLFRVIALLCSEVLVNGQCTLQSCANSASASVENIVTVLEEHDDKLLSVYKNLSSAFEELAKDYEENDRDIKQIDQRLSSKFEKLDERLARGLPERDEKLEAIYHNVTSLIQILSGGSREENKCHKIEEQQFMAIISSNISAKVARIQISNEDLERKFEVHDQSMKLFYENISAQIDEKLNHNLNILQQTLSNISIEEHPKTFVEHDQELRLAYQNVSIKIDKMCERFQESDERQVQYLQIMQQTLSNISADDLEKRLEVHDQIVRLAYQNVSVQIDEKLNQHLKIMQQTLSNLSIEDSAHPPLPENDKIIAQVMEHDRRLQMIQESFSSAIENLTVKLNAVLEHVNQTIDILKFQDYCVGNRELCDCSTIKANGRTTSEMYRIYVVNENRRYYANAYCDMTTSYGAWTIFQRRKDGSVDFYRGWNDYANGFGNPNGEFWLGNDFIHLLTSKRTYRLRFDLEDFDGNRRYAEYSTFNISSSADNYRLRIGNYSGDAGDSLSYHKDRQFSTKDADNDAFSSGNCAVDHRGAWWFSKCHQSNLNEIYKRGRYSDCTQCGIEWYLWRGGQYSLKTTEMKISPVA